MQKMHIFALKIDERNMNFTHSVGDPDDDALTFCVTLAKSTPLLASPASPVIWGWERVSRNLPSPPSV